MVHGGYEFYKVETQRASGCSLNVTRAAGGFAINNSWSRSWCWLGVVKRLH